MTDTNKRIRELLADWYSKQGERTPGKGKAIIDSVPGLLDENERLTECEETNSRINADLLTELYALKAEVKRLREDTDSPEWLQERMEQLRKRGRVNDPRQAAPEGE